MKQFLYLTLVVFIAFTSHGANASSNEALEQRILLLEKQLAELIAIQKHQNETAQSPPEENEISFIDEEQNYALRELADKDDHSIKIAGYADVEYKGSSEEGVNEEFRMHHLSLFFTKRFNDNIKFFSEIEYEDAPKFDGVNDGSGDLDEASGTILVEAMNFDWSYSQAFNIRAGRFFAPLGIWSEDHYPPYVSTQERPKHIFKIFPQFVDGMSVHGSQHIYDSAYFSYNIFTGNGESNVAGKKDLNSSKAFGFRGNFSAQWLDEFSAGFSLYRDGNDTANQNANKMAYGAHFKTRYDRLTVQFEYAKAKYKNAEILGQYNANGMYAQFSYRLGQFDVGYRYDVFNQSLIDRDDVNRHSVFFNYHYDHNITLKGEYHLDDFDNPLRDKFGFYIFSISAYLGE